MIDIQELENCNSLQMSGYVMAHLPEIIAELKAARSAIYFSELLTDSLIHYDDNEVRVNMVRMENLIEHLKQYDEVTGTDGKK